MLQLDSDEIRILSSSKDLSYSFQINREQNCNPIVVRLTADTNEPDFVSMSIGLLSVATDMITCFSISEVLEDDSLDYWALTELWNDESKMTILAQEVVRRYTALIENAIDFLSQDPTPYESLNPPY